MATKEQIELAMEAMRSAEPAIMGFIPNAALSGIACAAIDAAEADLPNDTISRVTQEIAAILSEPQNRERIARRIESAEPTTVSD